MADTDVSKLSFEQAMEELEKVVGQLESSSVALDDSIKLYDRGAALKAHCAKKLEEAEAKVAQISTGPDGKPDGLKPFDG